MTATVAAARAGSCSGCGRQGGGEDEDEEKGEEGRGLEKGEDKRRGDPHLFSIVVKCWC
jgi:hypothetical protein